jgi:hypothetical protein
VFGNRVPRRICGPNRDKVAGEGCIMRSFNNLYASSNITRVKGKGKGKVVPVLLLTDHHAMKAYWGVEV